MYESVVHHVLHLVHGVPFVEVKLNKMYFEVIEWKGSDVQLVCFKHLSLYRVPTREECLMYISLQKGINKKASVDCYRAHVIWLVGTSRKCC